MIKSRKPIALLFVIIALCLSLTTVVSTAANDNYDLSYALTLEENSSKVDGDAPVVDSGSTVKVVLSIDKNDGFFASTIQIAVPDVLEYQKDKTETNSNTFGKVMVNYSQNRGISVTIGDALAAMKDPSTAPAYRATGKVAVLVFKVKDGYEGPVDLAVTATTNNTVPIDFADNHSFHYNIHSPTLTLTAINWTTHRHTEQSVPEVKPTCTETGLTQGTVCATCTQVLKKQEVVAALGHNYGEWSVTTPATCNNEGVKVHTCDRCGHSEEASVPRTAHTEQVIPGKAATCTATGLTDGKKCSVCGTVIEAQKTVPVKEHTAETVPGKAATCTATGLSDGKKCSVCGTVIEAQKTIPVKEHTAETVPGKVPTCTETGISDGKKCSVCGKTLEEQKVIPAAGHKFGAWETVAPSACDAKGSKKRVCKVCGFTETEGLNETGHDWNSSFTIDKEPTCTTKGSKSIHCKRCDAIKDSTSVSATGHSFGSWVNVTAAKCDQPGTQKRTCKNCSYQETRTLAAKGHTEVVVPGKAPTCTESGLTEGKKCSACGKIIVAQKEVSATGHTEEIIPAKDATCTESGLTEGKKCSVCGEIIAAQTEVSATDHTEEIIPAKDATCTESGLAEGKKCSVCGEILTAQEEIPATGHKFGEWAITKAPTEDAVGERTRVCSVCGETETEEIPKLDAQSTGSEPVSGADDSDSSSMAIIIIIIVLLVLAIAAVIFIIAKKRKKDAQ